MKVVDQWEILFFSLAPRILENYETTPASIPLLLPLCSKQGHAAGLPRPQVCRAASEHRPAASMCREQVPAVISTASAALSYSRHAHAVSASSSSAAEPAPSLLACRSAALILQQASPCLPCL